MERYLALLGINACIGGLRGSSQTAFIFSELIKLLHAEALTYGEQKATFY